MALVGGYVAMSKVLVAALPVFLLAWLRFGIAAAAMPHWLRRPHDETPLTTSERRLLFLESFLGNFLFSICMLYGVALTSAVSAGVVLAAIPAAVALLSWWMLGERIQRRTAWAIALAVAGIGLLALARGTGGPKADAAAAYSGIGHLLLVGAVFCEAFYVVAGKRLSAKLSPRRISALINLWGLALMTPLGLWQASRFDFAAVAAPVWLLLVFYAV
ncbi:MAG: DMT family transporter, partial [Aquabacterium sp.]